MFSDVIKTAMEKEIVGQPRAVNCVVRGVTRLVSGLTPRDRSLCAFMLMGPTGTGKTHLIQTLTKILHGDVTREVVADCTSYLHGDPWTAFVSQLAPLFPNPNPGMESEWAAVEARPLSVVRIEYLERGPAEVCKAIATALETGYVMLPQGRRGSLRNCLIFLTSSLCSREILAEPSSIGFAGSQDDDESGDAHDKLYRVCLEQAEKHFGSDLMARLDGMIVFRGLQDEDLSGILDRRVERVNEWLALRASRCELATAARDFLLERGRGDLRKGAHDLIRAHTRFVEFPLADLLVSGRIPAGGFVRIDHRPAAEHLEFSVDRSVDAPLPGVTEVPVTWEGSGSVH